MRHRGLGWLRGGTGLCFPAEALQSSDGAKPERMCQVFLYCRKGETSAPRPTRPLTPGSSPARGEGGDKSRVASRWLRRPRLPSLSPRAQGRGRTAKQWVRALAAALKCGLPIQTSPVRGRRLR